MRFTRRRGLSRPQVQDESRQRVRTFSPRDYGARAERADNREPIQDAIDAAADAGGGRVILPDVYPVLSTGGSVGFGGAKPYGLLIPTDDITVEGPGGLDLRGLYAEIEDEYHAFAIGTPIGMTNRIGLEPVDALAGSYAKGVRSLALATPADAAGYQDGDWVYVRTGNLIPATTSVADSEINQIRGTPNPATGSLPLRWPTSKPFAQEWYITGTSGITSTAETANPAPYGVKNLSRPNTWVVERPAFRNLRLWADSAYALVTAFHPFGLIFDGIDAQLAGSLAQGTAKGGRLVNSRVHIDPPARDGQTHWIAAADTHSTDFLMENNDLTSDGNGWVHVHEGGARITIRGNRMSTADGATQHGSSDSYSPVNVESRAYDVVIEGNTIRGGGASGIRVAGDCNGGGRIAGNDIDGLAVATAVSVGSDNWHVGRNETRGKAVRRSIDKTKPGAQVNLGVTPSESTILKGWLTHDTQEITLGTIPAESDVDWVRINVNTAFDGDGTDSVRIGYDGTSTTQQAWAADTDVSSAATPNKTPVQGLGNFYVDTQRVAKAYYVNGGSEPSQGRVRVSIAYSPAPLRPT